MCGRKRDRRRKSGSGNVRKKTCAARIDVILKNLRPINKHASVNLELNARYSDIPHPSLLAFASKAGR